MTRPEEFPKRQHTSTGADDQVSDDTSAFASDPRGWTGGLYYAPGSDVSVMDTMLMPGLKPLVGVHQRRRSPSREHESPHADGRDAPGSADVPIEDLPTWILPVITAGSAQTTGSQRAIASGGGYLKLVKNLLATSGLYAIASLGAPLISLVLAPFLAHYLSRNDYGALTVLTTIVGLAAGITQLGLGSAFFRAYNYDYSTRRDRGAVWSTTLILLCCVTVPVTLGVVLTSAQVATILFGDPRLGALVRLAAGVVFLQNLSVPGFAWLRAESRAGLYAALSILNTVLALVTNIVLVGVLRWGVAGSLIATGAGYASVAILALPLIAFRSGIRFDTRVAKGLLAFGLPLVLNFASYWVLQLSDRYLLSQFRSLSETASYSVAYTLGSAINVVLIGPFTLAWPTTMYMIAKRDDAARIFRLVFRWLGMLLLISALVLSFVGQWLLFALFAPGYHSAQWVIPMVAGSLVFYGIYFVFMSGVNIKRKTYLAAVCTTAAAVINFGLNLVLIPKYGQVGAAASTFAAYVVLATVAYVGNQRIYPVAYEVGRFLLATLVGGVLYVCTWGVSLIADPRWMLPVEGAAAVIYVVFLVALFSRGAVARLSQVSRSRLGDVVGNSIPLTRTPTPHLDAPDQRPSRVCMFVPEVGRKDQRVLRSAHALRSAGYDVTLVDIEHDKRRPRAEDIDGIHFRHIMIAERLARHKSPGSFMGWMWFKVVRVLGSITKVVNTEADVYHAHDVMGLPACYLAARLHRKPLVYDAHELPLVDPHQTRHRLISAVSRFMLRRMMRRCTATITVSPMLVDELQRRYGGPRAVLVRNMPPYHPPVRSDLLRQALGLPETARIALYQGNLQLDRGLDHLMAAAHYLEPGQYLVLMGRDLARGHFHHLVEQEGLGNRVKILPEVPYQDLLAWTSSADLGLIIYQPSHSPNVRYCLPNKLFEYLMAGVPVLATPLDAVADILARYQVGYITSSLAPESVSWDISAILGDAQAREPLRQRALRASYEALCWERESLQLIGLYQRLLPLTRAYGADRTESLTVTGVPAAVPHNTAPSDLSR